METITREDWLAQFEASLVAQMSQLGYHVTTPNASRLVFGPYAVFIMPTRDDISISMEVGEDRLGWIDGRNFDFMIGRDEPLQAADEVREFLVSRIA